MDDNALVTWVECAEPWDVEDYLVALFDLPLNIDGNKKHPFCVTLQAARAEAKAAALAGSIYVARPSLSA